jgi:hypothetical protein
MIRNNALMEDSLPTWLVPKAALFPRTEQMPEERSVVSADEQLRDILLFAYVDGELDEDRQGLVEELLARDPDARQRVAQMRELNALFKAAYNEDGEETT